MFQVSPTTLAAKGKVWELLDGINSWMAGLPSWQQGFVGGIAASLVASIIFLAILACLRPRIKISKVIARRRSEDGKFEYLIKFVNRSFRSCVDMQLQAYIVTEAMLPANESGTEFAPNRTMRAIDLARRGPFVHGRKWKWVDNKQRHAQRVRIKSEHIAEWQQSGQQKHIVVRIVARDGVSGFPRVFERVYMLKTCIKDGTFITGNSLKVIPFDDPALDPSDEPATDLPDTPDQGATAP